MSTFEDILPTAQARSQLELRPAPTKAKPARPERATPERPLRAFTNRYEIKYLVKLRQLDQVLATLDGLLSPDRNGGLDGGYYVHSIYYDSPDLNYFREKMEGQKVRMKPRLRSYRSGLDGSPTALFLELKGRHDRIVNKRRCRLDADLAQKLLTDAPVRPNGWASDSPILGEFQYLSHRHRLQPCVSVLYHRTAYFGTFCPNLRITFDRLVQCSAATSLTAPSDGFQPTIAYDQAVVELKYNDKVPRMLLNRLHALGLQHRTFSKFATSMLRCFDRLNGPQSIH